MYECYTVEVEGTGLRFAAVKNGGWTLLSAGQPPKACLVNLIGDPGFCAVFRKGSGASGFFSLHDLQGVLFLAVAESNLAYGLGLAHMGRTVTYARYGADIFEELGDSDD